MRGVGWERVEGDAEESPGAGREGEAPAGAGWEPGEPYRPLGRRAKVVSALLVVGIGVDLVAVASGLMERSLLAGLADGKLITEAEADRNDLRQLVVAAVQSAVFVLTTVAFLLWFFRAYRNLPAVGAGEVRYRYGWAVGAWFVPILSLWRPKQIANDIWRGSDPDVPAGERLEWERRPVPLVFLAWWIGFLLLGSLYSFASRRSLRAETLEELREANSLFLAADIVSALTAVFALVVVLGTTRRQRDRARRLGLVPEEDATPLWRRRSAWAALGATLAGFALQAGIGVAGWTGALDPVEESAPAARPAAQAPAGTLLSDDFSQEGLWLVQDDSAVAFDYVDNSYRLLVKEPVSLWSTAHAFLREADAVSIEADATLHAGNVRSDYYGVSCLAASGTGYLFGISPDGYHLIAFHPGGEDAEFERLVEDSLERRFGSNQGTFRLRAECARQGEETALTLSVDGTPVARSSHRGPREAFVGVQVFAYSGRGGTEVRFDNLIATQRPAEP